MTRIETVYVITYCRKPDLLYGTTMVFNTIRVGFPDSAIVVIDNASLPEVRGILKGLADSVGAEFQQLTEVQKHHEILGGLFRMANGPFAVVDPDVMFWSRFDQAGSGLIEGRLIPTFQDPHSLCLTHKRLHTSLLKVPDPQDFRSAIEHYASYFDFDPFAPTMFHRAGVWERYDALGSIYALLEGSCHAFTASELDSYDHLFCGSHIDLVAKTLGSFADSFLDSHKAAQENDFSKMKGIWRLQQLFFDACAQKTTPEAKPEVDHGVGGHQLNVKTV